MSPSVLQRVEAAFRSTFPSTRFSSELSSEEVSDWDSMRQIHFVVALEKEFGIRFDGATVSKMFSIPAVVEAVSRRLEEP
jgi:acyl carrier protein